MRENILFFYKKSYGELHAGLPFILEAINKRESSIPYFVYGSRERFEAIPEFYKEIIESNFKLLRISGFRLFLFFLKNFFKRNIIFTCDNGHNSKSRFLTCYWPFSRIVFFAHAYSLLSQNKSSLTEKEAGFYENEYNGYHHEALVVCHNSTEINYRKNTGFPSSNIIVAGNIGYSPSWLKYLEGCSDEQERIKQRKKDFRKIIFIPVRDVHHEYLSYDNSVYLFESLVQMIKETPEYLFLIKAHPRQKNIKDFLRLMQEYNNVEIITLNTIVASSISDFVISYWSSAISDALATNTAVVEFHRHEFFHGQLVRKNKKLISLYNYYGLCPFYEEGEKVIDLLKSPDDWEGIRCEQQITYSDIYMKEYPRFVEELFDAFEKTPVKRNYFIGVVSYPVSVFKKIVGKIAIAY